MQKIIAQELSVIINALGRIQSVLNQKDIEVIPQEQKRESSYKCTVKRHKEFSWKDKNIDRDVLAAKRGGKHIFSTARLSPEKAQSFHSAICNEARRLIPKQGGKKMWRTRSDKTANTITLYVKSS